MSVSKTLKAKRLAMVDMSQAGDTSITYEERFLHYYNDKDLDFYHDGKLVEISADVIKDPLAEIEFTEIQYNFSKQNAFYANGVNHSNEPYHTIKHGMDGIVRGEIFVGEIDFNICFASPVVKYSKNLITGEYDFSETKTELVGIDSMKSSNVPVVIENEALPSLLELMIDVINNGTPTLQSEYSAYKKSQEQAEKAKNAPDCSDEIPF